MSTSVPTRSATLAHNGDPQSVWPHRIAVLLVLFTFPLIWVGGLVTSYKAGMAVYDWPNTFGYNMFLYPIARWLRGSFDLFIEHGHRLLASFVGCLTIVLCLVVYRCERRRWVQRMSIGLLLLVILQGVLGGMRVLLDRQQMALIHGCVANLFFASTVAVAVFTSSYWQQTTGNDNFADGKLVRLGWTTFFVAYLQIVIGAHVRHVNVMMSAGTFRAAVLFHLITAGLLALLILTLGTQIVWRHFKNSRLRGPSLMLTAFLFVQIALGAASWGLKYAWPQFMSQFQFAASQTITAQGMLQGMVATAHVATGSLILVLSLLISLRATRLLHGSPKPSPAGAIA